MATFTTEKILVRAESARLVNFSGTTKSASDMLLNAINEQKEEEKQYDIFLSHAFADAERILGIYKTLQDFGYTVFVDWINEPHLDRSKVTAATAETLRNRMKQCRSLFYATTENSQFSKWMPWECGYFDGLRSRTAILPITTDGGENYRGLEYLGIYPYITEAPKKEETKHILWVNRSQNEYATFDGWLLGKQITVHS